MARENIYLFDARICPDLMGYLFGSLLTISTGDIVALGVLSLVLISYFTVFYRTLIYISYDETYARTYSSSVSLFKYITTALVALAVVLNIRMAGVILVLSLLTIPPNIAMIFTSRYLKIIISTIIVGFAGTVTGLIISYFINVPAGATIVFILALIWIISKLLRGWVEKR